MPLCRQVYVRPDTGLLSIPAEASFFVLVPVDAGVDAEIVSSFSYSQTHGWSVEVLDVQRLENTCIFLRNQQEKGAVGYIILWALGVPVSVLLIVFLLRGCTE